ncbi:MAG: hypothetical protein ACFFCQ_15685, partial [Promethearchaeota archaeon]
ERLNNREFLEYLYIKKSMTIHQIAEELGCGKSTIGRYLKKNGIRIRPSPITKKLPLSTQQLLDNRDYIYQKYVSEQLSMRKIGSLLDCSEKVVLKALKKHEIPRRDRAYATHLSKRNVIHLTPNCLELIEGSLLGDGSLSKGKYSSYFTIKQSKKGINGLSKKGYILLHQMILQESGYPSTLVEKDYIEKRPRFLKKGITEEIRGEYHLRTISSIQLYKQRQRWYLNGKKRVPRDLKLTPFKCYIWYCEDGTLHRKQSRTSPFQAIKLCTMGFQREENLFLIKRLKTILGVKEGIRLNKRNNIILNKYPAELFLKYINRGSPCPGMNYKFPFFPNNSF